MRWYIEVLEGGHNTKDLLKNFVNAQAEIKLLRENQRYHSARMQKKLQDTKTKLKQAKE